MNKDKEKRAIQILRTFEPQGEPYWLCYSGGKDSDVISVLSELAGVNCERHYNLTTVDSPVTMRYIKSQPDVIIEKARWPDGRHKTMANLIAREGILPTKIARFCCAELKEHSGKGHLKITGVRAEESVKRARKAGLVKIFGKPKTVQKIAESEEANYTTNGTVLVMNFDNSAARRTVEQCYRTTSAVINPILDWTNADVWDFLNFYGCESNPEYKHGMNRIGCVGCPMGSFKKRLKDFQTYPSYFGVYYRACAKAMETSKQRGHEIRCAKTPLEYMAWWLGYADFVDFVRDYAEIMTINRIEVPKVEQAQLSLFDIMK